MKKKLLSMLLAAATALTAFSVPVMAAEEDTEVYSYHYTDYSDATSLKSGAGITPSSNSWGTPSNSVIVGSKTKIWWWCANKNYNSSTTQHILDVDLTKQGVSYDSVSDDVIAIEMDFGAYLKAAGVQMNVNFQGETQNGNEDMASMILKNDSGKTSGYMYFLGDENVKKGYTSTAADDKTQRQYVKVLFDMKNQTYSVLYLAKELAGQTEITGTPALMLRDRPFIAAENVSKPTKLSVDLVKPTTNDNKFAPISMKMTVLSDKTVVNDAIASLTIPKTTITNLTLPDSIAGADIVWESNNQSVISNTGTVTRPSGADATVTLTATVTRGAATQTKSFDVLVEHSYTPIEISDGIWTADEMNYANASAIPNIADDNFGFNFENIVADGNISSDTGVYTADGESITVLKGQDTTKSAAIWKYLAPHVEQQITVPAVVDFAFTPVANSSGAYPSQYYIALEQYDNWKGPETMNWNTGKTWTYTGKNNYANKKDETIHAAFVLNYETKKYDLYINGKQIETQTSYRDMWDGKNHTSAYPKLGRIQFSVDKSSPAGSGIKIDYIRAINQENYGQWCIDQEKAAASAALEALTQTALNNGDKLIMPDSDYNNQYVFEPVGTGIAADGTVTADYTAKTCDVKVSLKNIIDETKIEEIGTYTFAINAATPEIVEGTEATKIEVNEEALEGNAVGFYGTVVTSEIYDRAFGFRLYAEGKEPWDIKVPVPASILGGMDVNYGLILTADDAQSLEGVSAKTIYKDVPKAR